MGQKKSTTTAEDICSMLPGRKCAAILRQQHNTLRCIDVALECGPFPSSKSKATKGWSQDVLALRSYVMTWSSLADVSTYPTTKELPSTALCFGPKRLLAVMEAYTSLVLHYKKLPGHPFEALDKSRRAFYASMCQHELRRDKYRIATDFPIIADLVMTHPTMLLIFPRSEANYCFQAARILIRCVRRLCCQNLFNFSNTSIHILLELSIVSLPLGSLALLFH